MVRSTVSQVARDDRDIFEQTTDAEFGDRFPPSPLISEAAGRVPTVATIAEQLGTTDEMIQSVIGKPKEASLISSAASGEIVVPEEPGTSAFADWWGKDETQVAFQGIMGAVGAIGAGFAGIPAGGADMSSLERGAVRAARAPGEARKRMQQHKFGEYIDLQLKSETDPHRRTMLMAMRADPEHMAQYMTVEPPASKEARATRLAELKHELRMEQIQLQNRTKGGLTAGQLRDQVGAASWFRSMSADVQAMAKSGAIPFAMTFDPSAIKYLPLLYVRGGPLYKAEVDIDLSGNSTVTDPDTGEKLTIGTMERLEALVADKWGEMTSIGRLFWEKVLLEFRRDHPEEMSDEGSAAAGRLGLE